MKKINLCRIIYEFLPGVGGSVTHTVELSRYISPYLNKQLVIAPRANEDTTNIDNCLPFEVHRIRCCKFKRLIKFKQKYAPWLPVAPLIHLSFGINVIKKIISLNKIYGIDIIHVHGAGIGPAARIAGWIIKKPVVLMLHGTGYAYSNTSGLYDSLLTRIFKPSHILVLDDGSQAPNIFGKLMKKKTTTVYHAINTEQFLYLDKPYNLITELLLQPDTFILFSPHSLIPVKGQEYAIRGFSHFLSSIYKKNAFLIIAGSGNLEKDLKKLAKEAGVDEFTKFVGVVPNSIMVQYYALSDVVLATSLHSNMNRTAQEAMACAKPVITFDAGGTSNVIVDSQTGLLAQPANIEDLSQQIEKLYRNKELRKQLGNNAREFIKNHRSWESRIKVELDVYERLLTDKRSK
jgi:glycosyltransferase involved in cell wall biosynthesis